MVNKSASNLRCNKYIYY